MFENIWQRWSEGKQPVARMNGDWNEPLDCSILPLKVAAVYVDAPGKERGYALLHFYQSECRRSVTLLGRNAGEQDRWLELPPLPCIYPTGVEAVMAATRQELQRLLDSPSLPDRDDRPALPAPATPALAATIDPDDYSVSAVTRRYGGKGGDVSAQPALSGTPASSTGSRSAGRSPAQRTARREAPGKDRGPAPTVQPEAKASTADATEAQEWTGTVTFFGLKDYRTNDGGVTKVYAVNLLDECSGQIIEKWGRHLEDLVEDQGVQVGDRIWLKFRRAIRTNDRNTAATGTQPRRRNVYELRKLRPDE